MGTTVVVFCFFYLLLFALLSWLQSGFAPEAIPWADAFASASAYTGMWLMARKKQKAGSGGSQQILLLFRCIL